MTVLLINCTGIKENTLLNSQSEASIFCRCGIKEDITRDNRSITAITREKSQITLKFESTLHGRSRLAQSRGRNRKLRENLRAHYTEESVKYAVNFKIIINF